MFLLYQGESSPRKSKRAFSGTGHPQILAQVQIDLELGQEVDRDPQSPPSVLRFEMIFHAPANQLVPRSKVFGSTLKGLLNSLDSPSVFRCHLRTFLARPGQVRFIK